MTNQQARLPADFSRFTWRHLGSLAIMASAIVWLSACDLRIADPMIELQTTPNNPNKQMASMEMLDADPTNEAYLKLLNRIVWQPGYTVDIREEAIRRLVAYDLDGLKKTIRRRLPNMGALDGRRRICELIAEYRWEDLTPALVSAWAVPIAGYREERDRPEYQALAVLYGEDQIPDVVYDLFLRSNRVAEQGLRTRCWNLLHRIGQRERLIALLQDTEPPPDDAMLIDLHAGAAELGIVPNNREEILWLRVLRTEEYREYWQEAVAALAAMTPERRADLEMRDLAVAVSAYRHEPDLLTLSDGALYERLDARLKGRKSHRRGSTVGETTTSRRDRHFQWRRELTWGDLSATLIALRAFEVPQVVDHLFDYARRDMNDESTEYGGVIAIDTLGRFEVLEFVPRLRVHDRRFNASQEMFDASYSAIFHFHFHAQSFRNGDYAGPGYGDLNYADNTRANCLVLTFVEKGRMNVDFYRHGRVSIDLGEIILSPAG